MVRNGIKPKLKFMDKLILKAAVCFFLIFVMSGKAFKGLSLILWPEGNIGTLEKTMDLAWDKAVKYNGVSKSNSFSKVIQKLLLLICCIISYLLLL
jgi:hypothetical protein